MSRDHMIKVGEMKGPFGDIKLTFKHERPAWMQVCGDDGVWRQYEWVEDRYVERPWPVEDSTP